MLHKKSIACIFCLLSLIITGCWDNRELNDQALQLAVGFDWTDNGTYLLSNQFASNQGGGQGDGESQSGYYTETAEGKFPMNAVSVLQSKVTRQINRGQRRNIVIGERLARKGFKEILDYALRNPESPIRLDLFIVKNGTASELLLSQSPFGGQSLREYYKLHQANFGAVDVVFIDLIRTINEGVNPAVLLPAMERVGGQSGKTNKQSAYQFAGAALLNKETKLIGYLNLEETSNALWIIDWPHNHLITVPSLDGKGAVTVQLQAMKRKWKIDFKEGVNILLDLKADAVILENTSNLDMFKSDVLTWLNYEIEKETQERMMTLIRKFQHEFKLDGLCVGDTIYRNYPDRWKTLMNNWEDTFPKLDFAVHVDLNLHRLGLTGASGYLEKKDLNK